MSAVSFLYVINRASSRIIKTDNMKYYHRTKSWTCTWRRINVCRWMGMDILVSHDCHHIRPGTHRFLPPRDEQKYSGKWINPTTDNSTTP